MEGSEIAKRDHQRNKSEIVKLVKEMFSLEKWGDEEYKKKLQELVVKDEELVKDVIKKDIITNKSYDEFDIILNEVEDKLTNEESLEEISHKLDLDLKKQKLIEKKDFFYKKNNGSPDLQDILDHQTLQR